MSGVPTSTRWSWALLAAAFVATTFGGGRWHVGSVAWLAPALVVLYVDSRPVRSGLFLAFLAQLAAYFVLWWGMIPVPGVWYYLVAAIYALAYFLPYVVHRLIAYRFDGLAATLVLPVAWISVEFLFQSFVTPYGSWGSVAYTQFGFLPLEQFASVAGSAGVSFLVVWGAAVIAWVVQHRARWQRVRRVVAVYGVILAAVVVWGELRIIRATPAARTVRIAAITPAHSLQAATQKALSRVLDEGLEGSAYPALLEAAHRQNRDLIDRTRREAAAGARIVIWSETSANVTQDDQAGFLDRLSDLARDLDVTLVLGIGVWVPNGTPPFENELVALTPDGRLAWSYDKAHPVVGQESTLIERGDSGVATLDVPAGRLAAAICHDLDFPGLIRGAGRANADILIGPSHDWPAITRIHARMAMLRAIENGCTLARPCADGSTLFTDAYGHILAVRVDDGGEDNTLVAEVPATHVATLYPVIGDGFAYLCMVALGLLAAAAIVRRRGPDTPRSSQG